MAATCTAVSLADGKPCQAAATSLNGLFCLLHSRQCQGLYKGYKTRNARLDALVANPPSYLAEASVPLANQTFEDLSEEVDLKEVHDHLFQRYALLERVIRARKVHHSRFFAMNNDYGHQHFIDNLQNQRHIVLRALERLEKRTSEVIYQKQRWFRWVRDLEDEEESTRDNEKKQIKKEAALFQRHWKQVQARMQKLRAQEEAERSDAALAKAYTARVSESEEDETAWDPIEDTIEDERGNYLELISHFLWDESLESAYPDSIVKESGAGETSKPTNVQDLDNTGSSATDNGKNKKSKSRKTGKSQHTDAPELSRIETREQVRQRLTQGMKVQHGPGMKTAGTIEHPVETVWKTAPLPDDDIGKLLVDIREIKQLLFCRLLLSQTNLLPIALRVNSVEEFLKDEGLSLTDLRDLCLKMEQPGLQELRDACADLGREDESDDDALLGDHEVKSNGSKLSKGRRPGLEEFLDWESEHKTLFAGATPKNWVSRREKELEGIREQTLENGQGGGFINFGDIDDGLHGSRKIRVKICGRYIYNYPSAKSMKRSGWLQYSVIAKDSSLFDAMSLCRNWNEFFELSVLANYQYFPASNWSSWFGDRSKQQLLSLGLIPYFHMDQAERLTSKSQTGSRAYGMRRQHAIREARSFLCAHMARNDPVSRRFVQYLSMASCDLVILVRDAKTGDIIVKPPEEELWLVREKVGLGRAAKNDWNVISEVGSEFFEQMDEHRKWHFGFKEHYDLIIWDQQAGLHYSNLYNNVQSILFKAHRFRKPIDLFDNIAFVLKTIGRDPDTQRTREVRPGESSIYDQMRGGTVVWGEMGEEMSVGLPAYLLYSDTDALEDAVLFPEEDENRPAKGAAIGALTAERMHRLETGGFPMGRFVLDLDTDEELSDHEAENTEQKLRQPNLSVEPNGDLLERKPDAEGEDEEEEEAEEDDDDEEREEVDEDLPAEAVEGSSDESVESLDGDVVSGLEHLLAHKTSSAARKSRKRLDPDDESAMREEWEIFLDRYRAATFKDTWHNADLSPDASARHQEYTKIIKELLRLAGEEGKLRPRTKYFSLAKLHLSLKIGLLAHRKILRDLRQAYVMIVPFFPALFDTKHHPFHHSLLYDQTERATQVPARRSFHSNKYRPKAWWKEWDVALANEFTTSGDKQIFNGEAYPDDWNRTNRPIIAKLYKEGVIKSSYNQFSNGQAVCLTDPGTKQPDLFFDWRHHGPLTFPPDMQDPTAVDDFLPIAKRFVVKHPEARFALLRVWSAPHFYPLMLGLDNRDGTSFTDGMGRIFEWKFIPKDMPCSEFSIHHTLKLRLEPYKEQLRLGGIVRGYKEPECRVVLKRDGILVMGADEEECARRAIMACFAVQTRPWRLEIDMWRSFVGVDLAFLEGLDEKWLV